MALAVDAHTHLYSGLAPLGLPAPEPPPENFLQILGRLWWRLDRALDERSLAASAEFYASEALALGCFGLVDHHESPEWIEGSLDVLADACQAAGLRAVLCYGATERNGGRDEARRGLAECERFLRANRRPLVRGAVGLHASFTVSDETIREAATLARDRGSVLHVHVAEDGADVEDARRRGYAGVIDRLARLAALVPGSIFAHGVHLDVEEVKRVSDAGCWLVQNPRSNQGNRVGYPQALAHAPQVALGTDGYPADMAEEEAALLAAATAAGDDLAHARGRAAASERLLAERFGAPFTEAERAAWERACAIAADGRGAVRQRAQAEAERLWSRMRALPR